MKPDEMEKNKWYKVKGLGVIMIEQAHYRPESDVYDLLFREYDGTLKYCILTSEAVEDNAIEGPATLDDIMVSEL